jgi:hypothetical protein
MRSWRLNTWLIIGWTVIGLVAFTYDTEKAGNGCAELQGSAQGVCSEAASAIIASRVGPWLVVLMVLLVARWFTGRRRTPATAQCSECGRPVTADAVRCASCGHSLRVRPAIAESRPPVASLPATKTCPDCAEEIKAAAHVCRFCGHRFAGESVSQARR